jgi:dTDP-4-amino-4,6-dideoxygalactose transaminase
VTFGPTYVGVYPPLGPGALLVDSSAPGNGCGRISGCSRTTDRLVGLPVHQELRSADVDRIADAVGAARLARLT